jgi:hypothetical protein
MTDDTRGLDDLSTAELHDRAMARARSRWDVGFFWRLIRMIPAAEMAAGNVDAGRAGVSYLAGLISDILAERGGDPHLIEALRPVYIDYLSQDDQDS